MKQLYDVFLAPLQGRLEHAHLRNVIIFSGIGYVLWRAVKNVVTYKANLRIKMQRISANRQAIRDELKELETPLSDLLELADKDLSELCTMIQKGELDHDNLFRACQAKALQLDESGQCAVAEFATRLGDMGFYGEKPALYGIPISVNECCGIYLYDTSTGLIKYCADIAASSSCLVSSLECVGAIPFVTTISSQLDYSPDGYNPIYGNCTNPFLNSRMSGGGSCGECVLVAMRCSFLGIGMDILGGVRIPAAFCGVVSLKTTSCRLSTIIASSALADCVICLPKSIGLIGRKTEDIARLLRVSLSTSMFDYDPTIPRMHFNERLFPKIPSESDNNLYIGFYESFYDPELVDCASVCQRAVDVAVKALTRAGHRTVRFEVPEPKLAFQLVIRCLIANGGRELRAQLEGEPLSPHLKFLYSVLGLPNIVKRVLRFLSSVFIDRGYTLTFLNEILNVEQDALKLFRDIEEYRHNFFAYWRKTSLEAVVCPVSPYVAPPQNSSSLLLNSSMCYAVLYNLLDMPAGTVPVGYVKSADVQRDLSYANFLKSSGQSEKSRPFASINGGEGLPLSVQVVALPCKEEVVLRVMRDIENNLEAET